MEWWRQLPNTWKAIVAILAAITTVIGTYRTVDAYFAKQLDLERHKAANSLDLSELSNSFRRYQIRQEIRANEKDQYELKRRLRESPNRSDQDRLDRLKMDQRELERDLQDIKAKGGSNASSDNGYIVPSK